MLLMLDLLKECTLCPRNCGVNRLEGERGFCQAGACIKIARAALHHWEEPCISGHHGSGTVFFSHCNLQCVFCQNVEISQNQKGQEISIARLSEIFFELEGQGAHNINLVTPTHYVPQIIEALKLAKAQGLKLPIVYNTSGYEKVETLQLLRKYVDIYLPDMKYYESLPSAKYSKAPDYFKIAKEALHEMVSQVGEAEFDEEGFMQKGVIVRHLMMPGLYQDSKKVITFLYNTYGDTIYLSLMNQYTPLLHVEAYPELNKKISLKRYEKLVQYALDLGLVNGFIQEGDTAKESFIPPFNEGS